MYFLFHKKSHTNREISSTISNMLEKKEFKLTFVSKPKEKIKI